ncbi:MAG TPA: carboxypeptidase-like regulatory domain-containing protein [Candidatus Acidoferrales bacterium]|nr:carboxypeptidase-like regulatory domain-containing protein [Candidatus Acidoferrales bacterium]
MNGLINRRRFARRWKGTAILAAALLCTGVTLAQNSDSDSAAAQDQSASKKKKDQKSEQLTVKLEIHVTNANGKPVSNASVYVRYNEPGGFLRHDKLAELDLKTNEDGSVKVPPVPQGKIMIQVIATGWHTYGKWYDIEKDEESVQITLKPPPHWY